LRRSTDPMGPLELGEGTGAGGFVAIGIVGLVATGAFLQNVWPLGQVGSIFSGGTLLPINLMVGIEVGAGIVIVLYEFLQQTLLRGRR
jgi:multicomponent Na+:H+ antiporter subunit B